MLSRLRRRRLPWPAEAALVLVLLGAGWLWWQHRQPRSLTRDALDLRDGVLFVRHEPTPFDGLLVENYPGGARKLMIEIHQGLADGVSLGWFENGQLEVEEHFVGGRSHGRRTRWYPSGQRRCVAFIVLGRIEGVYEEWHPNGRKGMEITYRNGKPDGEARAWSETGVAQPPRVYRNGELVTASG